MDDQTTALLGARPIEEMLFEGGEPVRDLLRTLGIKTARDIELLGCTGAKAQGLSIEQISALRLSLAGGGVGLPCFVGIDRFCLAHNTIGGLQVEQEQRHPEFVEAVSRELTREERGRIELIEAARRKRGKTLDDRIMSTTDILAGRELPDGFEAQERVLPESGQTKPPTPTSMLEAVLRQDERSFFVCVEHKKTNWACRYCVAQAIVEGPLVPEYVVKNGPSGPAYPAADAMAEVETFDLGGALEVTIYVRAARFTRRLAREE
jgi:hypothetical protein